MRVTSSFSIAPPVPFVDVHVERDNLLFLDPRAIRNSPLPEARKAQRLLEAYFTELMRLRLSSKPSDHVVGRQLLDGLSEPNEVRLGYSRKKIGGHAIGEGIADDLWVILGTNLAARNAALTELERVPLFIPHVGPDLISDLTVRVVFEVLADYTAAMMVKYPSLNATTTTATVPVFDLINLTWASKSVTLPYLHGHQLLLIPKDWVFWRFVLDPTAFYNRYSTTSVQRERTTFDADGKPLAPSKAKLNEEFPYERELNTVRAVHHAGQGHDLAGEYGSEVDRTFQALDDDEIERRTS